MPLDEVIVRHCSATLAGVKPSNLVTITYSDIDDAEKQIDFLNKILNAKGVFLRKIKFLANNRILLFVYNEENLKNHLFQPEEKQFLKEVGYPIFQGFQKNLEKLEWRFTQTNSVPHEVGVFLGYPILDVRGFIENHGCNFKCACRWKIYGDESYSMNLCRKYCECEQICLAKFQNGISINYNFLQDQIMPFCDLNIAYFFEIFDINENNNPNNYNQGLFFKSIIPC